MIVDPEESSLSSSYRIKNDAGQVISKNEGNEWKMLSKIYPMIG